MKKGGRELRVMMGQVVTFVGVLVSVVFFFTLRACLR